MRNTLEEFFELRKERTGEIDLLTVLHLIPLVAPPNVWMVDGEYVVAVVRGNELLAREIARALVERARVALGEPTHEATRRALRRRRNVNALVEAEITILNHERQAAFSTLLCRHDILRHLKLR